MTTDPTIPSAGTGTPPPWQPPLASGEVAHLTGALDRLRATFRWKVDGLDEAGLRATLSSSALTLAGLLKHLAAVEDHYFTVHLRGEPIGSPWPEDAWDGNKDWEFESALTDGAEGLYALYDGAVARARARLAAALTEGGLDQEIHSAWPDGRHANLRRMLFDLVEEYGRHTGHADLLRESVDGRAGEDPPEEWRPVSGDYRFH